MRRTIKAVLIASVVLFTALSATGAVTATDAGTEMCTPASGAQNTVADSSSSGTVTPDCGTSECDITFDCDERDWW